MGPEANYCDIFHRLDEGAQLMQVKFCELGESSQLNLLEALTKIGSQMSTVTRSNEK